MYANKKTMTKNVEDYRKILSDKLPLLVSTELKEVPQISCRDTEKIHMTIESL